MEQFIGQPGMAPSFPGFVPNMVPGMPGFGFYPYPSAEAMYHNMMAMSLMMPHAPQQPATSLVPARPSLPGLNASAKPFKARTASKAPQIAPIFPGGPPATAAPTLMGYLPMNHPGDGSGVIHWIATECGTRPWTCPVASGKIQVASSELVSGSLTDIVAPNFTGQNCFTEDSPSSWMRIDLQDTWVVPEAYVMAHQAIDGKPDEVFDGRFMRNWTLWASADGEDWVALRTHVHDDTLNASNPYTVFTIQGAHQHFRQFCVQMDSPGNSDGSHSLVMSCFELYGFAYHCKGSATMGALTSPPSNIKVMPKSRTLQDKLLSKGSSNALKFNGNKDQNDTATQSAAPPKTYRPVKEFKPKACALQPPWISTLSSTSEKPRAHLKPQADPSVFPLANGLTVDQIQAAIFAALTAIVKCNENIPSPTSNWSPNPMFEASALATNEGGQSSEKKSNSVDTLLRFFDELKGSVSKETRTAGDSDASEDSGRDQRPLRAPNQPCSPEVVLISSLQPITGPATAHHSSVTHPPVARPFTLPSAPNTDCPVPPASLTRRQILLQYGRERGRQLLAGQQLDSQVHPHTNIAMANTTDDDPDNVVVHDPAAEVRAENLGSAVATVAPIHQPSPSIPCSSDQTELDADKLRNVAEDLLMLIKSATEMEPSQGLSENVTNSVGGHQAQADLNRRVRLGQMILKFLDPHCSTE